MPLIEEAQSVWVMGWIARNAVTSLYPVIPQEDHKLTPPYRIVQMPKIFVSRYLSRISKTDVLQIARQAIRFMTELKVQFPAGH